MSERLDSDQTKKHHPEGPTVPSEVDTGDSVYLNGRNASVYSGLTAFKCKALDGQPSATLSVNRSETAIFQVHPSFSGKYEVAGEYDSKSPVSEEDRIFGIMNVTQTKKGA